MSEMVTVIGYSFDAVIEAVCQASEGKQVKFLATAEIAEPLDRFGDMVSGGYAEMLSTLFPGIEFTEVLNPRNIYIPYEGCKLDNRTNGSFRLPFSKNSFSPGDWEEISLAFRSPEIQECYLNKSATPSKLVAALKGCMPKKFNDTFGKALSVTRWRGIKLSNLTMFGYEYEYKFDHLDEDYGEMYCRPNMSYNELARRLLERFDVSVGTATAKDVKRIITDRNYLGSVKIMDNRVDSYMGYMCGRFDRVAMDVEKVRMPRQFATFRDGIYYTPLSDFWAVIIRGDEAYKCSSRLVAGLNVDGVSEIPLTRNNVRVYDQYVNLIKLYGNKEIDLGQRIETLVK